MANIRLALFVAVLLVIAGVAMGKEDKAEQCIIWVDRNASVMEICEEGGYFWYTDQAGRPMKRYCGPAFEL